MINVLLLSVLKNVLKENIFLKENNIKRAVLKRKSNVKSNELFLFWITSFSAYLN